MTTLHIPPPAVPVEVTAEQVVAYLLRPGSGWVEMTALSSPHYIEFELRPRAHDQNDGACGVPREACKRPIPNMLEAIADIARAEGRHPLAVAEEIAGPARAAGVGARCRGAGTSEDYDSGRVKCMARGMAHRWRAEARVYVETSDDTADECGADPCPGKGRCHGAMKWCETCGPVAGTCDDTACDQHSAARGAGESEE